MARNSVPPAKKVGKVVFFSGDEAFKEVAKVDGAWNWALVGPDPEKLPLSGGGAGSIDEMREAVCKHATSFGLLRMTFGVGRLQKTKWVFVYASNVDDQGAGFSMRERGQATLKGPQMEKTIGKYTHTVVKVEVTSMENCRPDYFIDKVKKVSVADAAMVTLENYQAAMEEFRQSRIEEVEEEEKEEEVVAQMEEQAPVAAEVAEVVPEPQPEVRPEEAKQDEQQFVRQRKPMRLFKKGDNVQVFSNAAKTWHDDGVIVETITESGMHDGFQLPAGSMKAQYANGRRFKWVTPAQAHEFLKLSTRPTPPPPMVGELFKETHNFITEWHVRHFELSKGFLQWWMTVEEARSGARPNGVVSLLGLQMRVQDTVFNLRTASTKGVIYAFDATTVEGATQWTNALNQHAEYCEKMRLHLASQGPKEGEGAAPPAAAVAAKEGGDNPQGHESQVPGAFRAEPPIVEAVPAPPLPVVKEDSVAPEMVKKATVTEEPEPAAAPPQH